MDAIRLLKTVGVDLLLISGRTDGFIRSYAREIGTRFPVVSLNGGLILDADGQLLYESLLPADVGHRVLAVAKQAPGMAVSFLTSDGIFSTTWPLRLPRYLAAHPGEHRRIEDPLPYIDRVAMIVIKGPYSPVQDISVGIARDFRGMVDRVLYRSKSGGDDYYLELKNWGVNKGKALRFLSKQLDLPAARIGAIGDYANDLEMCRFAGFSAAMRNAIDDLKARTDMVTRNTNNESGVAEFLTLVYEAQAT